MKLLLTTVAAALIAAGGYTASATEGTRASHHRNTAIQTKMAAPLPMCKQMMADMAKAKSHMKDMDAKLDLLVSTMDSATGEDRVTAMSAVIKELVSQRSMMRTMKEKMDAKMMAHMMEHMKMPMKSGKMDCPMMKEMMRG